MGVAETGAGTDLLLTAVAEYLFQDKVRGLVRLDVSQARLRALLYGAGQILNESMTEEGGWNLEVELLRRDYQQLSSREGLKFFEQLERPASTGTIF